MLILLPEHDSTFGKVADKLPESALKQGILELNSSCWFRYAAKPAAAIVSLIQSARLNGHDPYAYLKDFLTRLQTQRASEVGQLLPHQWGVPNLRKACFLVRLTLITNPGHANGTIPLTL